MTKPEVTRIDAPPLPPYEQGVMTMLRAVMDEVREKPHSAVLVVTVLKNGGMATNWRLDGGLGGLLATGAVAQLLTDLCTDKVLASTEPEPTGE